MADKMLATVANAILDRVTQPALSSGLTASAMADAVVERKQLAGALLMARISAWADTFT